MSTRSTTGLQTTLAVRGIFALWLAATLIGTLHPDLRMWGLHLPAFLPLWLQVVFFGVGLVLIFLPGRIYAARPSHIITRILQSPLPAALLAAGFIIFRASPALLGDGMLRGREAQAGIISPLELLPGWLSCRIYDLGRPLFGIDGQGAVAIVSLVAGCLFLFFIWYYPRRIWSDSGDRRVVRLFLAAGGFVALFFGYVESYALPCAMMIGVLLAAEAHRHGKGPFYIVVLLSIVAIAAHFMTVVLLPALSALALIGHQRRFGRLIVIGTLGAAASLWLYFLFFVSVYAQEAAVQSVLISFLPEPPVNYGLVSPAHLLDLVNLLLLIGPGVLIAVPLILSRRGKKPNFGDRAFWPLAVCGSLCLPVLVDPKLGMARDWDLFGLGMIPLIVWVAARLADRRVKLPPGALVKPLFAQFTVLMMFAVVNSHPPLAVARFEKLLAMDQNRGGYGHEVLAVWHRYSGRIDKEIFHWQKAASLENNKRYWGGLAQALLRDNNFQFALQAARRAYTMDTSWAKGASYLASAYREVGMTDSALAYYYRSLSLNPNSHGVRHDLATLFMAMGRHDDALQQIDVAIGLAPDSAVYLGIRGWILMEADQAGAGERYLREALLMEPQLLSARVNLCRALQQRGRSDSALIEIGRVLQRPGLPPELRDYLERLDKFIREKAFAPDSAG